MAKFKGALSANEPIIDDDTPNDNVFTPVIDGQIKAHGLVPRHHSIYPPEMFDPPSQLKLIPRSEWSDRIKEMEKTKSRISDMLLAAGIPSTDQNGDGYCWMYSVGGCIITIRCINNQPYAEINPHGSAAIVKGGKNEGGWCGLGAKFAREVGMPTKEFWPGHSRDVRRYDTAEMRANAALHKTTEEWVDLTRNVYDQNLVDDVVMTCLLLRIPVAGDFNWWSHSVLLCDPVEPEPGSFGKRLRNSWTDSYGEKGFAVLRGSRALTNGAVAIRSVGGSQI